jgi:osmotically-inducible protein OsmY
MMNRKFGFVMLMVVLALPMLAACATHTGVENVDEATLESAVRAKIATVVISETTDIGVKIEAGTVTLSGTVDTADERTKIVDAVSGVDGVKRLINNLLVK